MSSWLVELVLWMNRWVDQVVRWVTGWMGKLMDGWVECRWIQAHMRMTERNGFPDAQMPCAGHGDPPPFSLPVLPPNGRTCSTL